MKIVVATIPLATQTVRSGFSMVGMRHPGLDPFMDVTLFSMSEPTFPPHPHAGFSAVTYMLPESDGSFINRDSLGDRSIIGPGAIHWTQSGAGMMHEEIPEHAGVACRGFQMFVKLPAAQEMLAPIAFHADANAIPVVTGEGWSVRVLAGALDGASSPLNRLAHNVILYDLTVEPGAHISIPTNDGTAMWAMLIEGEITVARNDYLAKFGVIWSDTGTIADIKGGAVRSRVLVGGGKALREGYQFAGPFALSTRERLTGAKQRFSSGVMGTLEPSF
jgi:redox-sensitive bicupin YhaK (pirin superfamily)